MTYPLSKQRQTSLEAHHRVIFLLFCTLHAYTTPVTSLPVMPGATRGSHLTFWMTTQKELLPKTSFWAETALVLFRQLCISTGRISFRECENYVQQLPPFPGLPNQFPPDSVLKKEKKKHLFVKYLLRDAHNSLWKLETLLRNEGNDRNYSLIDLINGISETRILLKNTIESFFIKVRLQESGSRIHRLKENYLQHKANNTRLQHTQNNTDHWHKGNNTGLQHTQNITDHWHKGNNTRLQRTQNNTDHWHKGNNTGLQHSGYNSRETTSSEKSEAAYALLLLYTTWNYLKYLGAVLEYSVELSWLERIHTLWS